MIYDSDLADLIVAEEAYNRFNSAFVKNHATQIFFKIQNFSSYYVKLLTYDHRHLRSYHDSILKMKTLGEFVEWASQFDNYVFKVSNGTLCIHFEDMFRGELWEELNMSIPLGGQAYNEFMHDTRLPLQKWFLAIMLIANAKKGISSRQLARDLGLPVKMQKKGNKVADIHKKLLSRLCSCCRPQCKSCNPSDSPKNSRRRTRTRLRKQIRATLKDQLQEELEQLEEVY